MSKEDAEKILGGGIQSLRGGADYAWWHPRDDKATLDGQFTADELIAIGTLMKEES